MDYLSCMKQRRSVRTFNGEPLRDQDAQAILSFAEKVETPYDLSIEWKLLDAKKQNLSAPVIAGTDTYIAGKMRRAAHTEEAFGYAFEKVVLFAESRGVGTTWIAGTMNRAAFEQAMALEDDEVMPCVSPLGYPAARMSLRETVMRKGVKADTRLPFTDLFFGGSFETPLTPEAAGRLQTPLEMVRLAPSAVNKQPWRAVVDGDTVHFFEKRSKGYRKDDGWDLQKVDLGIALCHFELAAQSCGLHPVFTLCDPAIALPENTFYIASYRI